MACLLSLTVIPGRFAVCRMESGEKVPEWAASGGFWSLTKTPDELSIVCPEEQVPREIPADRGWKGLGVEGPLDLSLTGVLDSLTDPLASAGISLFVLSTYKTDYILVREESLEEAIAVLAFAGHQILSSPA